MTVAGRKGDKKNSIEGYEPTGERHGSTERKRPRHSVARGRKRRFGHDQEKKLSPSVKKDTKAATRMSWVKSTVERSENDT
jgi:hypothetical protein